MKKLATLTAAAALVLAVGLVGTAKADFTFPFDSGKLVGYWHFDTNSGTDNAVDGSVNTNIGVFNNAATRSTDIPDVVSNVNSITLGGNNDFVGIADDDALDLGTGDLSIDAWIKTSANTGTKVILDKRPLASNIGYHMFLSNGDLGFQLADGTSTNFISGTDVADGDWHHVAVTVDRDDAASGLKLYVDGTVVDTFDPTSRAGSLDNDADLFIGKRRNNTVSASFNGLIDEVRIYDVALPAGDIQTLAHTFPGTVEKELVSGPNANNGDPIDVDVNPFDAGGIEVNRPDAQHFEIKITITNDGEDGALNGLKIFDVVGAEFDPDPDAEDASIPEADCTVEEGGDGTCDGIQVVGGNGDCTASITPHESGRKLDPHFILIVLDDLLATETCEVTVWVETDENPASEKDNKDDQFEPTSCDLVMDPDLFNTFTLNEGLKVFDPDSEIRLLGPADSLQLTCNFPS